MEMASAAIDRLLSLGPLRVIQNGAQPPCHARVGTPPERHFERNKKLRIAAAISSQCVSRAKWPVSKKRTSASGMSRLNASAPGGRKNGSFLPQAARNGGLWVRK